MKILQVNCVYRNGSTGKIMYDIHCELRRLGVESVVCYGRGQTVREPGVYKVCPEWYSKAYNAWSRLTGLMYGGLPCSTRRLERIILRERPDVVHLHCINGYFVNIYHLVGFLKRHHIRTVLSLHAEFMHTANCGYALDCERWRTGCGQCPRRRQETKSLFVDGTARSWRKMRAAFEGFGPGLTVTSVSPWLMERAKQSPILGAARHVTVMNGLDTGTFHPYGAEVAQADKVRFGLAEERKIVFHATPGFTLSETNIKGGRFVCELAQRMPGVEFVVAGPYDAGISVPENVKLLGRVSNQEDLASLYSLADATVLTSRKETFSMVTAESLSCGTPLVGFLAGGPESIAPKEYASFVEYADVEALKAQLEQLLARPADREAIASEAEARYARRVMTEAYINVYKNLIDDCKE